MKIMKKYFYLISVFTFLVFSCKKNAEQIQGNPLVVNDADGNVYATIEIGNQIRMKENLKTTKYNDGTPITKYVRSIHGNNWLNFNTPTAFYQWADTSDLNNVYTQPLPYNYYGAMYNHLAIESGKLAPLGWRIPNEQDFLVLKNYLANNGYAGREALALKSSSGWIASIGNGFDAIGFNGLPNGYVNSLGGPTLAEGVCTWATSDFNQVGGGGRKMVQLFDQDTIIISSNPIEIGAGIRCIKE